MTIGMTTLYVDPINGDDGNPGTTARPTRTLARAIAIANASRSPTDAIRIKMRAGHRLEVPPSDNAIWKHQLLAVVKDLQERVEHMEAERSNAIEVAQRAMKAFEDLAEMARGSENIFARIDDLRIRIQSVEADIEDIDLGPSDRIR